MIPEEIKTLVRQCFPDLPTDDADRLPMDFHGGLVVNVWPPTRANLTDGQVLAEWINNEGRMKQFRHDG